MSINVGIEGERDQGGGKLQSNNGKHGLIQSLLLRPWQNIVKSSLGPQGLDKMIVDDIGEVLITNDGTQWS